MAQKWSKRSFGIGGFVAETRLLDQVSGNFRKVVGASSPEVLGVTFRGAWRAAFQQPCCSFIPSVIIGPSRAAATTSAARPFWPEFEQVRAGDASKSVRVRPNLCLGSRLQRWARFDRIWSDIDQIRARVAQAWAGLNRGRGRIMGPERSRHAARRASHIALLLNECSPGAVASQPRTCCAERPPCLAFDALARLVSGRCSSWRGRTRSPSGTGSAWRGAPLARSTPLPSVRRGSCGSQQAALWSTSVPERRPREILGIQADVFQNRAPVRVDLRLLQPDFGQLWANSGRIRPTVAQHPQEWGRCGRDLG